MYLKVVNLFIIVVLSSNLNLLSCANVDVDSDNRVDSALVESIASDISPMAISMKNLLCIACFSCYNIAYNLFNVILF